MASAVAGSLMASHAAAFAAGGVEEMILSVSSLPFAVYDWSALDLIGERLLPDARLIGADR